MHVRSASACRRLVGVAALLVVVLLVPLDATAEVRGSDLLGERAVSTSVELESLAPDVTMPSGVLETSDGQVLWARDGDAERAMASTTKIMTAIVVLDTVSDLSEVVSVPTVAARVGESGVGLKAGQQLTVRKLLEAMLVHSGNDAATTLAVHVGGSVDGFVKLMNEKAESLSLSQSQFANPHGLDEPGHHTSAVDLATMAQYAMNNPEFREIVGMRTVSVPVAGGTSRYDASNLLIGKYEGATGVKTGWTNDAGYCLVASAERDGVELFAVILGTKSEDARFVQAKKLLDWGFEHYGVQQVTSAEETASIVAVTDYLDQSVAAIVAESASVPVYDVLGDITVNADVVTEIQAPVVKGQRLGTLSVQQGGRLIAQVPIISAADVPVPDGWARFKIAVTRLWRKAFGGQLQAAPVTVM
jgi:D-alanyl-D-alanine carboxypeptidase (penicillin-binding protein 5/6)